MIPKFSAVDFVSFYVEIPVMFVMYVLWMIYRHTRRASAGEARQSPSWRSWFSDLVNVDTVDLFRDEYVEQEEDKTDGEERKRRIIGRGGFLWRIYYWVV